MKLKHNKCTDDITPDMDLNSKDLELQLTPLVQAAHFGHLSVVVKLIEAKADINVDHLGGAAIFYAVASGHFEIVQKLVEAGADVNQCTKAITSLLIGVFGTSYDPMSCGATDDSKSEIVGFLLEAKVNIEFRTSMGHSHAVFAAQSSRSNLELILNAKACVTLRNKKSPASYALGVTALGVTLLAGNGETRQPDCMHRLLLEYKADPHNRLPPMQCPETLAVPCVKGVLPDLKYFHGIHNVNIHHKMKVVGGNVLHFVILFDHYEVARYLLSHRVSTKTKFLHMFTAMDLAKKHQREELVNLLQEYAH